MRRIESIQEKIQERVDRIRKSALKLDKWAAEEDEIGGDLADEMINEADDIVGNLDDIESCLDELMDADGSSDGDLDRLHEAICEGRKQDAIDILADMFPDHALRSVRDQNALFPNRVVT